MQHARLGLKKKTPVAESLPLSEVTPFPEIRSLPCQPPVLSVATPQVIVLL